MNKEALASSARSLSTNGRNINAGSKNGVFGRRWLFDGRGPEALHNLGFVIKHVEHRPDLSDRQELLDACGHVEQPQSAAPARDARVRADNLAKRRAVDVRGPLQILVQSPKTNMLYFEDDRRD